MLMQFGLFMMPLHPPERSFTESYDRDLAQIVLADRLGYHEVWIGERPTEPWENAPAPELLIAQALLKTREDYSGYWCDVVSVAQSGGSGAPHCHARPSGARAFLLGHWWGGNPDGPA